MALRKIEIRCPVCNEYRELPYEVVPEEAFEGSDPVLQGFGSIDLSCGHQTWANDYDLRPGAAVIADPAAILASVGSPRLEMLTVADSATVTPNQKLNISGAGIDKVTVSGFPVTFTLAVAGMFTLEQPEAAREVVVTFEAAADGGSADIFVGARLVPPPPPFSRTPRIPFVVPFHINVPRPVSVTVTARIAGIAVGETSFEIVGP